VDLLLQQYRFTNVYRELDRGTRFVLAQIIPHAKRQPDLTMFNLLVYRKFNLPATYAALGFQTTWHVGRATRLLQARQRAGLRVQSPAYMITAANAAGGRGSGVALQCGYLGTIWRRRQAIWTAARQAGSMAAMHAVFTQLPGYGDFTAYEIVTDLGYSPYLSRFTEDDWVFAGPGCRRALDRLLVESPRTAADYAAAIAELREQQEAGLAASGIPWLGTKRLTLRSIEHALCEFYKYRRMQEGGHHTRRFVPQRSLVV
jgi:hypothetical protein